MSENRSYSLVNNLRTILLADVCIAVSSLDTLHSDHAVIDPMKSPDCSMCVILKP
jgi:hypothetical protein